jgi:hypothetical protein
MRTLMLGTLLVTFLSGTTTGILIGNSTAEAPKPLTWIDQDLQVMSRTTPGISPEDLVRAREIYEDHWQRIRALKVEAEAILGDQLLAVQNQTKKKIEGIRAPYLESSSGAK